VTPEDLERIATNVRRTGFVLEYDVTRLLHEHRWTVINSRYYLDDVTPQAREMDVIAYKVRPIGDCLLYTTLVISCKKSAEAVWGILFREADLADPNMNWHPVRAWSNHPAVRHMLVNPSWRQKYVSSIKRAGLYDTLFEPVGHVFAFQEFARSNGTPRNDTNLFLANSSLMKAEAYELGSLERRKTTPVLYNFNLISVVDFELVAVAFQGNDIRPRAVTDAVCVVNYIVNRTDTVARIHITTMARFDALLERYDALHEAHSSFFATLYDSFFDGVFSDDARVNVYRERFERRILWAINSVLQRQGMNPAESKSLWFRIRPDQSLAICVAPTPEGATALEADLPLRKMSAKALLELYRYSGEFHFEDDSLF
jgi:hypothetical protein